MAVIEQAGSKGWKIRAEYTIDSQSISNNSSTITCTLYVYCPGYSYNNDKTSYYTIQGGSRNYMSYDWGAGWHQLGSRTFTVLHNSDGAKTFTLSCYFYTDNETTWTPYDLSLTASVTLTRIPRFAYITGAMYATDEDAPTITYKNPAGNAAVSLQARIVLGTGGDSIPWREISKTAAEYKFVLTPEERKKIHIYTQNTSSALQINYQLWTDLGGGASHTDTAYRTVVTVNAEPSIASYSVKDTNANTIALTGDATKLIKGISTAVASMTASPKKEASIKEVSIESRS